MMDEIKHFVKVRNLPIKVKRKIKNNSNKNKARQKERRAMIF